MAQKATRRGGNGPPTGGKKAGGAKRKNGKRNPRRDPREEKTIELLRAGFDGKRQVALGRYSEEGVPAYKAVGRRSPVGGAFRAELHASDWQPASLKEAVRRVAGESPDEFWTPSKTIYKNPVTGAEVVHDRAGDYFRVTTGGRRPKKYLDVYGQPSPTSVPVVTGDGREVEQSVPVEVQKALTHFRNSDGEE